MTDQSYVPASIDSATDFDYPSDLYSYIRTAEGVDTFDDVSEEQIQRYKTEGFLVIERAFDLGEVRGTLEGLLDLIDGKRPDFRNLQFEARAKGTIESLPPERKQDYVRKLMGFVNYDDRLAALAEHPRLTALLSRIIGEPNLNMFQDMALLKPPGVGREKPWHQDKAFFNLKIESPVVGVWIALDEATPENGCMRVIPGSHLEGPVVHFVRRDWQICDSDVQTEREVAVPLRPGGCLLFDGLMQHGTPANRTSTRRRAVQLHYTAASAVWGTPEERMAIFGSEGRDVSC